MTAPPEITVTGVRYWAEKPEQLAQLLATSNAPAIRDPSGQPIQPNEIVVLALPKLWSENPRELGDALAFAVGKTGTAASGTAGGVGAVAPVEKRLVFTVEEAAQLLGISRSFAYEAVQRGEIPSMRIGRRILVPKAALQRFLNADGPTDEHRHG
jgi:excisionase family DNA binding protein